MAKIPENKNVDFHITQFALLKYERIHAAGDPHIAPYHYHIDTIPFYVIMDTKYGLEISYIFIISDKSIFPSGRIFDNKNAHGCI